MYTWQYNRGPAHLIIDEGLAAELAVGSRVDEHLPTGAFRAVRNDFWGEVNMPLVEGGQGRACADTHR